MAEKGGISGIFSDSFRPPPVSMACSELKVYPFNLKSLPKEFNSGKTVWQLEQGSPVCRAKLGTALDGSGSRMISAESIIIRMIEKKVLTYI